MIGCADERDLQGASACRGVGLALLAMLTCRCEAFGAPGSHPAGARPGGHGPAPGRGHSQEVDAHDSRR